MASTLPTWPPTLQKHQLQLLSHLAVDYALSHSIIYRPSSTANGASETATAPHDSSIHAPISLLPSPFPRDLFEKCKYLQPLYNDLYSRIALDHQFLTEVIGGNVILVDDFQAKLWKIYQIAEAEGRAQSLHLGIFRSDYLLHSAGSSNDDLSNKLAVKQVELNTISSSFGPLCARVSEMHRYLVKSTSFCDLSAKLCSQNLPKNDALHTMTVGLATGHNTYCKRRRIQSASKDPIILFVVQDGERNAFDQRLIEYELLDRYSIRVRRATLHQLASIAHISEGEKTLLLTDDLTNVQEEVSVVYFRAGYSPSDYPNQSEWDARLLLERSLAVKCPTVALQLAGAKKVQQVLADEGVLERFVKDPAKGEVWSDDDLDCLRQSFMPMFGMEDGGKGIEIASDPEASSTYVLKPQREGGGNNIYRSDITKALAELGTQDIQGDVDLSSNAVEQKIKAREAYILMKLIETPKNVGNYLIRYTRDRHESSQHMPEAVLAKDVVSELGVFGTILFEGGGEASNRGNAVAIVYEQSGGHLLRTKASDSDEGGVAAGFSVIDSPLLV